MSLFSSENTETSFPKNIDVTLKRSGWERIGSFLWALIKIFFFLVILGGIFFGGKAGIENISPYKKTYYDGFYRTQSPDTQATKIATIQLSGEIFSQNNYGFNPDITISKNFISLLADTIEDKEISAVLIQVNSPGGEVFAAEEISQAIDILKSKTEKPIYIVLESMAASGGYYIATSGDKIFAYPETLLGNIGVRVDIPNAQGLMEKVGVEMQSVTSGKMKTMGSPFRKMTEEEEKVFTDLIDESFEKFVDRVVKGRKMTKEEAKKLADGRIFSGTQGFENGLVDQLVTSLPDLQNILSRNFGNSKIQFVSFEQKISPWEELMISVENGVNPLKSEIGKIQKVGFLMQ